MSCFPRVFTGSEATKLRFVDYGSILGLNCSVNNRTVEYEG